MGTGIPLTLRVLPVVRIPASEVSSNLLEQTALPQMSPDVLSQPRI